MLALKVQKESDFDRQLAKFAQAPDLIQKALRAAISDTVDDLHAREVRELKQSFDKPTDWIIKGLKKSYPGGKDRQFAGGRYGQGIMRAGVYVEEFPVSGSQADVLAHHIHGGGRNLKRNERRINGIHHKAGGGAWIMGRDFPKNGNGNIAGHWYSKMLHDISAMQDTAPSTRRTDRKVASKKRKNASREFFISYRKPWLILQRIGRNKVRVMLVRARGGSVRYKKRFDFYGAGASQVQYSLPIHFNRIFNRYIGKMAI